MSSRCTLVCSSLFNSPQSFPLRSLRGTKGVLFNAIGVADVTLTWRLTGGVAMKIGKGIFPVTPVFVSFRLPRGCGAIACLRLHILLNTNTDSRDSAAPKPQATVHAQIVIAFVYRLPFLPFAILVPHGFEI